MTPIGFSLRQGLLYSVAMVAYLLVMMRTVDPRVWGYTDYPERVKRKVPPPTEEERRRRWLFAGPYLLFFPTYPVYSLLRLRAMLGGAISFMDGFMHLLLLAGLASLGDLVILDWLIISRITPRWVVIEGSDAADYKDFTHHYVGHVYASVVIVAVCAVVAYIVSVV
ncbi:hypothetical protein JXL21_07925 [Candidatus Bathyarchaeota archaeon]|nr:hypothetical protein [Candidatus Bathyarchaeota archaeon]